MCNHRFLGIILAVHPFLMNTYLNLLETMWFAQSELSGKSNSKTVLVWLPLKSRYGCKSANLN